jgi:SAM-dependent methyltransferase
VGAGDAVLDVGTGTGIVALQAAVRAGAPGRVLGIDLSEGMLAAAGASARAAGVETSATFRRMDAENLDIEAATFDVVLSLFALLHFPDPLRALGEMRRVLRPGGRLVVAIGSGPPLFTRAGLARAAQRLPEAVRRRRGRELGAPAFLDALVEKHCPEPQRVEETELARHGHGAVRSVPALVRQAGFDALSTSWEGHRAVLDGPQEFWDVQQTYSSFARKRLAGASAERVQRVREEFQETCGRVLARGGSLVYRYGALFVAARRPGV